MKNKDNNLEPNTNLNEDISKLYHQFDHNLNQYHEINFYDSTQQLRDKWPLLKEIEACKTV